MGWNDPNGDDTTIYKVVVNHEEQYSIWPEYKQVPLGWKETGKSGLKAECLAYIKQVWIDMRPLSLRKKMEEFAKNPPPLASCYAPAPGEKTLVDRLCESEHVVEVGLRDPKTVTVFKEAIDRDSVYIKFIETKGGTELGIRLDRNSSDFSKADFANGKGSTHLEGTLTFDYVKVKCIADIDLATLTGKGRLTKI